MKIKNKNKKILFLIVAGFLLFAAYTAVHSFLFPHGTFPNALLFDLSDYELNFNSLFLAGLVVFGALAGLFGMLAKRILAKYRLTGEQFKNLVELSNDIITITDKDGKLLFMNDAACRILERKPIEVIGSPFMELVHPDDRKRYLGKREELEKLRTDTFIVESRFSTKSGKSITVLHTVRVLTDNAGALVGMLGIARNITEGKRAEESMQKALARVTDDKTRLESILSTIDEGISIQNTDFKVLYRNQAHLRIFGREAGGGYCYQAYTHADSLCPGCPVEDTFKDGKIHRLEKELSSNGDVRIVEIKASPVLDASGNVVAGIEEVRDITARKRAEEKLRMFSVAIEEAIDGIQIVDLDDHIVYSNKAIGLIYGFSHEELVGKHISEMNADREFADRFIIPKVRETGQWSGELMAVHKDRRTFPIWFSTSLVKSEHGRPIAMISSIQDITERKQAEETMKQNHDQLMKLVEERTRELSSANQKLLSEIADREKIEQELLKSQKLESLGILAGGIAHDFNNLLASIAGNISLAMLDVDPTNSAYRQLEGAEKASLRARDLIRQLLTFSKGGAPVKKAVAIGDLIREVTGFTVHGSRVKFFFSLPEDLWPADADEGQISQVLHNLIINADQAMPRGGTITISCENTVVAEPSKLPLKQGNYVRINIRDHGIGITQENLSKIFDPYFTTKQKGSGLGLAMAYSIISQHSGHIYAESKPGKGTTLIIYLPATDSGTAQKGPVQ
ncbi:MAG: PAS domain S-box protein [Nitrospirae bacterium]|nr:PAS domain S-box protein [Nitrospirota bacterium]